jgi:hypothetical protein
MLKKDDIVILSVICVLTVLISIVCNYPFTFPDGCDGRVYYHSLNGLGIVDKHPLMVAFFPLARLFDMTTFIILLTAIPAMIFYSMIWMTSKNKWLLVACMTGHLMFNPAAAEMMALDAFMFAISMRNNFLGLLGFAISAGLHRFGFAFTAIYAVAEHIREEWPSWIKPLLMLVLCIYFFRSYWISYGISQNTYYEFPSFAVLCMFPMWFAINNITKKEHVSMIALLILLSLPSLLLYYMGTSAEATMRANLYNEFYRIVVYAGIPLAIFMLANEGPKKYKSRILVIAFIFNSMASIILKMLPAKISFGHPAECSIIGTFIITSIYLALKRDEWMVDLMPLL